MKLIVGLGNHGEKYDRTRHNAGYMLIDQLQNQLKDFFVKENHTILSTVTEYKIGGERVFLVKPFTFMNHSGDAVYSLSKFYKIPVSDIWVAHDDLDIVLGEYKIQQAKGPKVHNGVNSIEERLGSTDFHRIRIGIENREVGQKVAGEKYVLGKFTSEELVTLNSALEEISKNNQFTIFNS